MGNRRRTRRRSLGQPIPAKWHNDPPGTSPPVWPRNEDEMPTLQRQDPNLEPIIHYLTDNPDEYHLHDTRTLFYLSTQSNGNQGALRSKYLGPAPSAWANFSVSRNTDVVVLPVHLRHQLLHFYHDQNGHPVMQRTKSTIKLRYWWNGMSSDILDYVSTCL